ncbi:hypothetical protein ABT039_22340 [Streptomyces lasiicapitis]|uniref:hypothetical protein n=1 Tax=Streptomyces lasiicapitis TaxID=1923961 RepID=UPI003327D66B
MPDSTTTDSAAAPSWLAAAEEVYEHQQIDERANHIMACKRHAEQINDALGVFGIEPLQPARLTKSGQLEGAVLVGPDFEAGTYEVRALWDVNSQQIELHTADWETDRPRFGRVGLMSNIADVAAARRETPKFPAPRRNLSAEALQAIDSLSVDRLNNHDVEAVVTAIHGLTAAVLHVGDLIARGNDRP